MVFFKNCKKYQCNRRSVFICLVCDRFLNMFQLQMKYQHFGADFAVGVSLFLDFKLGMNSTFGFLTTIIMPL